MWPLIAVLDQPGDYAIAWENGQLYVRKLSELQEKGAKIVDISQPVRVGSAGTGQGGSNG